jgi:hypothetical protein
MNLIESIAARVDVTIEAASNSRSRNRELSQSKHNPVCWINHWAWTYDPREKCTTGPFDLFPKQEEFIHWLAERDQKQECGLAEKSRDVGFTWLCAAYSVHRWLFKPGDSTGFGSRKLDVVDDKDNPDCIFEKIRFLINHLPIWMRPAGFEPHHHDKYCTLVNPANGSTITGEGGAGGKGTFNARERESPHVLDFTANAVNVGDQPTDSRWPDGKTSKERFRNLRAELWWKQRGIASPDFADALVLAFASKGGGGWQEAARAMRDNYTPAFKYGNW